MIYICIIYIYIYIYIPLFSITISAATVIKGPKNSTYYIIHNLYDVQLNTGAADPGFKFDFGKALSQKFRVISLPNTLFFL